MITLVSGRCGDTHSQRIACDCDTGQCDWRASGADCVRASCCVRVRNVYTRDGCDAVVGNISRAIVE
jgi:hypothetical protein